MTAAVLTLHVGGTALGVDVWDVREVVRNLPVTPVPLAPAGLVGLANLRGEVVTVLDLGGWLDVGPRPQPATLVVLAVGGGLLALLTDEVGEVRTVPAPLLPPPDTLPAPARDLLAGVQVLDTTLLHVLDSTAVCRLAAAPPPTPQESPR